MKELIERLNADIKSLQTEVQARKVGRNHCPHLADAVQRLKSGVRHLGFHLKREEKTALKEAAATPAAAPGVKAPEAKAPEEKPAKK